MIRKSLIVVALIFASGLSLAQTSVTGTIKDANNTPYANGTVQPFYLNNSGVQVFIPTVATNGSGAFSTSLLPNTYGFIVCAPAPLIGPRGNQNPLTACFTSSYIPISGASQDVSTAVSNSAAVLGPGSGSGALPPGLTFAAPTLTVSTAGSGNGTLALSGTTSGTATLTAPAVAGTTSNPIVFSNAIQIPNFAAGTNAGIQSTNGGGINFPTSNGVALTTSTSTVQLFATSSFITVTPPICDAGTGTGCLTFTASKISLTGTGSPNFGFGQGKGQHFVTQAATSDTAGVCSGTTTTCAVTFTTNYTSTPSCVITPTTAGVTSAIITTQANSGFTVTYAPTGTTNFNYVCIGNPN